jgi:hypothetical protein
MSQNKAFGLLLESDAHLAPCQTAAMLAATDTGCPRVVLVHGLFMGRHAMLVLAQRLRRDGFEVQCFAYNTVTGNLDANVAKLRAILARDSRPLALVGHSLGGLVSLRAGTRIGRSLHDWASLDEKPTVAAPVFTLSGTQSAGLGRLLCRFTEPNDGTVTLAETRYPGATSCVMPVSHTGMLFSQPVATQVAAWLRAVA